MVVLTCTHIFDYRILPRAPCAGAEVVAQRYIQRTHGSNWGMRLAPAQTDHYQEGLENNI